MSQLNNKVIIAFLTLVFLMIAIPRIQFPDLDHGDEFSDANALNAGENFVKFGFRECFFLPMFDPGFDQPQKLYTRFPPLPDLINGFIRTYFHTDSLYVFRGVALFFGYLNLIFWFLFIKCFSKSLIFSFLATVFYLFSPLFILGVDSVHMLSYADFLRSLILFLFLLYVDSKKGKSLILCGMWIVIAIQTLISYEYVVYLGLFFLLYKMLFAESRGPISLKDIFIIMTAPVFSALLHFAQNIWYFGRFSPAFYDLKDSFLKRTTGGYELSQGLNFLAWFKYVILRNFSLVFYFDTIVVLLSIFFAFLLYSKLSDKSREQTKKLFCLFIILIVCGISWYIFFPSHSLSHAFVNFLARYLVPASAIGFAIFTYIIYAFLKENNLWSNIYLKTSWIAIVSIIIFTGIIKSELPITPDKIERAQDFKVFTRCLLKLREISGEKDDIGVNYFRFPFIRYYAHRNCNVIFDKASLEKLSALPDYFIFIPYNDQKSQELFELLQEKYVPLWQCDSLRFPAIFFKMKII